MKEGRPEDDFLVRFGEPPPEAFADSLYERLEALDASPVRRPRLSLPWMGRPAKRLAVAALALLLLLITIAPAGRAHLADWLQIAGLTVREEVNYPLAGSATPPVRGEPHWDQQVVTLADARERLPFPIELPRWIPEGYERLDEVMLALPEQEEHFSMAVITWCHMESGECLRLTLEDSGERGDSWLVGPGSVEEIEVNGRPALFVRGAWDGAEARWDGGEVVTVSWRARKQGIAYHLMASEGVLPRDTLIRVAESVS